MTHSTAWKDLERRVCTALGGRRAGPMGAAVSDCVNVPFAVEIKRSKRGVPEGRWIGQARDQGKRERKSWLLVVAGHGRRPIAVIDWQTFLHLATSAGLIPPPEATMPEVPNPTEPAPEPEPEPEPDPEPE